MYLPISSVLCGLNGTNYVSVHVVPISNAWMVYDSKGEERQPGMCYFSATVIPIVVSDNYCVSGIWHPLTGPYTQHKL